MQNTTRRAVLSGTGLAAIALAAPSIITPRRAAAAERIVYIGWGGTTQDAETSTFIATFEKESGTGVVIANGPDLGKLKAQTMAGSPEWDVLELPGPQAIAAERQCVHQSPGLMRAWADCSPP